MICLRCGEEFRAPPSAARRFCSSACYHAAQIKHDIANCICVICGAGFYRKPSHQTDARYCSRKCLGEARHRRVGLDHPLWKGRTVRKDGYVRISIPGSNQRQYEHRLVAEEKLGRKLKRHEHVHHINGITGDNRPENLLVLPQRAHAALHGDATHGESHPAAKLTAAAVAAIRAREKEAHHILAKEFGVSKSLIGKVLHRKIWRHEK